MIKKSFCAATILSFALVGVVSAQGAISSVKSRSLHKVPTKRVGARCTYARAIHRSCSILRKAAKGLRTASCGREAGMGTPQPDHHKPLCQVPKACRLGAKPVRTLFEMSNRRALSKIQPAGGLVRSLNTTADVERRIEKKRGAGSPAPLYSICNLYIFLTSSL